MNDTIDLHFQDPPEPPPMTPEQVAWFYSLLSEDMKLVVAALVRRLVKVGGQA
jgi:hypothetical protein